MIAHCLVMERVIRNRAKLYYVVATIVKFYSQAFQQVFLVLNHRECRKHSLQSVFCELFSILLGWECDQKIGEIPS